MNNKKRVVITGMGIVSSIGNNVEEVKNSLIDQKSGIVKSNIYKESQNEHIQLKDEEDEFVDDSGYTVSSHKTLDRSISSADIELANKINILKESGLI